LVHFREEVQSLSIIHLSPYSPGMEVHKPFTQNLSTHFFSLEHAARKSISGRGLHTLRPLTQNGHGSSLLSTLHINPQPVGQQTGYIGHLTPSQGMNSLVLVGQPKVGAEHTPLIQT